MAEYVIHPIVCGLNATDQGIMTYLRGYGRAIHIPVYVWLLLGGDAPILIDTGLADFMIPDGLEAELGVKAEYFEEGLAARGVKPEDVGMIIHTHLHNDHCENDGLCAGAIVYAQQAELDFMHEPHPLDHRYDAEYLEGVQVASLSGSAQLAPGVGVIPTPGHTPGGQSVLVNTKDAGRVLITGFCCNEQNFPPAGPAVCPGVHTDALMAWRSANQVKAMKEAGEIDLIVPLHALWPARQGIIT
ncbi:MAG: MBL fold metallo-hydrolase [Desulfovibrio sp.]|nr:MBL fold metallo-hydrolase [Desulfovibrio sp.]